MPQTETKKIIINRQVYRTAKEAQSVAAKVTGAMRRKKKIQLLQDAYLNLLSLNGCRPTQKEVHEFASKGFKVGIRTIKGYWKEIVAIDEERCS
jgi:hypothetical protein